MRFTESVRRLFERQKGVILRLPYGRPLGIKTNFETQIKYYLSDPHVKGAIDTLAETAVGHGFYIKAEDDDAKACVEEFCEEVDLDGINQNIARELWATGNAILEKVDPDDIQELVHLPISTFHKIYADPKGKELIYEQKLGTTINRLDPARLIHYRYNRIDASITGHGLIEPLINQGVGYSSGKRRPAYLQIKEEIEDSMRKVLRRYVPRHAYILKGFKDADVKKHAKTIRDLEPEDDLIIGSPSLAKQDIAITRIATDPRSRLDPFIEYFYDGTITALETPTIKLFLERGFTEASARVAVDILDRKVSAFRRFLKRMHEREIFKPVVMQRLRYTEQEWKKAKVRLVWGAIKEPEVTIENILKAGELGFLYPQEIRKFLHKKGIELLSPQELAKLQERKPHAYTP